MTKTARFLSFHHFLLFLIESSSIGGTRKGEEKPERGSRGDAGIAEGVGDFHVGGSEGSVDGGCMSQMLSCGITLTHGDKIGMARMVFFM